MIGANLHFTTYAISSILKEILKALKLYLVLKIGVCIWKLNFGHMNLNYYFSIHFS